MQTYFIHYALLSTLFCNTRSNENHDLVGIITNFVNHFDPKEIYVLMDRSESTEKTSFCKTLSKALQSIGYSKMVVVTNTTKSIGVNGRDLSRNVVVISLSTGGSIFQVQQQVSWDPPYKHLNNYYLLATISLALLGSLVPKACHLVDTKISGRK